MLLLTCKPPLAQVALADVRASPDELCESNQCHRRCWLLNFALVMTLNFLLLSCLGGGRLAFMIYNVCVGCVFEMETGHCVMRWTCWNCFPLCVAGSAKCSTQLYGQTSHILNI